MPVESFDSIIPMQVSVQFKMQGPDLEKFRCTGIFFSQVEAALKVDYEGQLYLEKVGKTVWCNFFVMTRVADQVIVDLLKW